MTFFAKPSYRHRRWSKVVLKLPKWSSCWVSVFQEQLRASGNDAVKGLRFEARRLARQRRRWRKCLWTVRCSARGETDAAPWVNSTAARASAATIMCQNDADGARAFAGD